MEEPLRLKEEDEDYLAMIQRGFEESRKVYDALPWVVGARLDRERRERELQATAGSGSKE